MRIPALFLCLCLALPALADEDDLIHPVRQGDTLIGLAEHLLANPADWVILQRLNQVRDPRRLPVGSILRIPRALLRPEPRQADVVSVAGQARVDGQPLAPGAKVGGGQHLETGDDGHIELRLPDGSTLLLPARSSIRIKALNAPPGKDDLGVDLKLDKGRLESSVTPRRGPTARFRVDTPSAVIGVRGTRFRVGAAPETEQGQVEVTEGTVAVQPVGAKAAERALEAGYGMVVRTGAALPEPVPLPAAPATAGLPALFEKPVLRIPLPGMPGVRAWRLRLWAAVPDAPVVLDRYLDSGPALIPGLADGDYHLTLRTIDAQGLEGRDAHHDFQLRARPEPPFLQSPVDAGKAPAGRVEFRWTQAPEAARYRLQVSRSEDFAAPVLSRDDLVEPAFSADLPAGAYHWRLASVRADGRTGPWGDAGRFVLRPLPEAPAAPVMTESELNFRWAGEPGQQFEYQFTRQADFSGPPLASDRVAQSGVSLPRPGPGSYWIRVRTLDPDGYLSPWSGAQRVDIRPPPAPPEPPPYWLMLFLPVLFAL